MYIYGWWKQGGSLFFVFLFKHIFVCFCGRRGLYVYVCMYVCVCVCVCVCKKHIYLIQKSVIVFCDQQIHFNSYFGECLGSTFHKADTTCIWSKLNGQDVVVVRKHLIWHPKGMKISRAGMCWQTMETLQEDGELVFLYHLTTGHTSSSYAAHTALQAGLPPDIVRRGQQVFFNYSSPLCLSICPSLSVCLSVCLSVSQVICFSALQKLRALRHFAQRTADSYLQLLIKFSLMWCDLRLLWPCSAYPS